VPKTGPAPKKNEFKSRRAEPQFDATALPARGVGGMHRTQFEKKQKPSAISVADFDPSVIFLTVKKTCIIFRVILV